jgi:hypothetical protein
MAVRYCEGCGTLLGESAKYCKHCGAPVRKPLSKCSVCGAEPSEGDSVCRYCGAPLLADAAPDEHKQGQILRVCSKYHPVWIFPAAVLLTLVFVAAVQLFSQLFSDAFPCENYCINALLIGAIVIAAFYISRAIAIYKAGWRGAEFKADKKEFALARKTKEVPEKKGKFTTFLLTRPAVLALTIIMALALIIAQPSFPVPDYVTLFNPKGTEQGSADSIASETASKVGDSPDATNLVQNIRICGIWDTIKSDYMDSDSNIYFNFLLLSEEKATFGYCVYLSDVASYAETGVVPEKFYIDAEYDYMVTEASFTQVLNLEEDYLSSCIISMTNPSNPNDCMMWSMDFMHSLTNQSGADKAGFDVGYVYYRSGMCAVTREPVAENGAGTMLVDAPKEPLWGVWVSLDEMEDYKNFDYHKHRDIPFVFLCDDYRLFVGQCTGAKAIQDLMCFPDEPSSGVEIQQVYTYDYMDILYAMNEDQTTLYIDSIILYVTDESGNLETWVIRPGSQFDKGDGTLYGWSENCEWLAP